VRFERVTRTQWLARMEAGEVMDAEGIRVVPSCPFTPGRRIYYFRTLEHEEPVPFQEHVLWQDEHLLVVDKPHFLPVIPSGKYVQETVLVRLKRKLGLSDLSPIHRIDRDTAGLVLFSVQPSSRNAYHALFRERRVDKVYECIARWDPTLDWPVRRHSRISAAHHFMQQSEIDGVPNALTTIEPLQVHGEWARYQLVPVSGQRHQLRVHMNALGLPIEGDGIYPRLLPEGDLDYTRPLQLLAREIAFIDPISGEARRFASQRMLRSLR
jgi:tRNA pseudouridine32 synthase/23S rRNA pseudouridine746 synthase